MTPPNQTHTTASKSMQPSPEDEGGVPIATWAIGGAAVVVVLTAGAVLFGGDPPEKAKEEVAAEKAVETKDKVPEKRVEAPKHPLDITAIALDSQERAQVWNPQAALIGIELVIKNDKPAGAISFEYATGIGSAVPGTPVGEKRYKLSYEGGKNSGAEEATSDEARVALPAPNCPVDVAFRNLKKGGAQFDGPVGALYVQSSKHRRPVWLLTSSDGSAHSVDADNCAQLRR